LKARAINRAGRTIVFDLRAALFDQIQRLSLQYHSRRETGDLMARVTSDVRALKGLLTSSILGMIAASLLLLGMAGVLIWLDWRLALIPIGGAPFMGLLIKRYLEDLKFHSREQRRSEGALATVLSESLGAVRLTRIFNREDQARQRFLRESEASLEQGLAATMVEQRVAWGIDSFWSVVIAAVLGFGVYRVMSGTATAGELVVFVHYSKQFYKPLRSILRHLNKTTRAYARAERVVEILEMQTGVVDRPDAVPAPPLKGEIEFRNVSFAYEGDQIILKNIDLRIPEGSVSAIVGPTGAGKTTLASLIPRLYDPTFGEVTIDGRDIREYTLSTIRAQIGMVLQESILLRTSVAENIAFGRSSATMEDIHAAAEAAHAHEFISKLPQGYETEIGERGETLSGGQRQRIAIARAMVGGAPILILDEPLAGLDPSSTSSVMSALQALMKGKTVIIITHQLETIRNADQIAVMGSGRTLQIGRYAELVEVEGKFRELCNQKEGGFLGARS
jgi:subfamily B ATP-binding cassette protein MsbA